jgi:hypothetical protein
MFILSVTLAHEFVHTFVGMLKGSARSSTPLRVHFDIDELRLLSADDGRLY